MLFISGACHMNKTVISSFSLDNRTQWFIKLDFKALYIGIHKIFICYILFGQFYNLSMLVINNLTFFTLLVFKF